MHRFHTRLQNTITAIVQLFGLWTLLAQICVLAGASYATLRTLSVLPVIIFIGVQIAARNSPPTPPRTLLSPRSHGLPQHWRWLRVAGPFIIIALYLITKQNYVFWVPAMLYLTAMLWFKQDESDKPKLPERSATWLEIVILIAICATAGVLTAGSLKFNIDDAYYVNVAVTAVGFPDLSLQSFDGLHYDDLPPVEQMLHLPQVFEFLVGLLSDISGQSILDMYYVILPPMSAVLSVLVQWLLMRHFLDARGATWGTVLYVLLLAYWGDGRRAYGNYTFEKMFQGKTVFLTVMLPMIVLSALRYRDRPGWTTWLNLAICQCAALGMSVNAAILAPLAAGLALIGKPHFNRKSVNTILGGVTASAPLAVIVLAMFARIAPYMSSVAADKIHSGYAVTLGNVRTPYVLLALIILPALASITRVKHAEWITGYIWIVTLLVLAPFMWLFSGTVLGNAYYWRWMWAIPTPFLLSLAGAAAINENGKRQWITASLFLIWFIIFLGIGSPAIKEHFSFDNIGQPKVREVNYSIAQQINALTPPGTLALAPEEIAVYMTYDANHPPLVGVRDLLIRKLEGHIPDEQYTSRLALFEYIDETDETMSIEDALASIAAYNVGTVVFHNEHRDAAALEASLTANGFTTHRTGEYLILVRDE